MHGRAEDRVPYIEAGAVVPSDVGTFEGPSSWLEGPSAQTSNWRRVRSAERGATRSPVSLPTPYVLLQNLRILDGRSSGQLQAFLNEAVHPRACHFSKVGRVDANGRIESA